MTTRAQALADVRTRREQLLRTCQELQSRIGPTQLAQDALSLIDPQLTILGRLRAGVEQNKLLSLAVLAGIGWLVGAPRRHNGASRGPRDAGSATRKTMKETTHVSGEEPGYQRRNGNGGEVDEFVEGRKAASRGQADEVGGSAPLDGSAKVGRRRQVAPQDDVIPEAERG